MTHVFEHEMNELKEKLLTMASQAESATSRAVQALVERDDDLARRVQEDDAVLDRFELEVDETSIGLLAKAPLASDLRLITVAMKISQNLERVGDEATKIARRSIDLSQEPQLKPYVDIPRMAALATEMLKTALDALVRGYTDQARAVIQRDAEMDEVAGIGAANPKQECAERGHRPLARAVSAADHTPADLLDHGRGDETRQAEAEQRTLG